VSRPEVRLCVTLAQSIDDPADPFKVSYRQIMLAANVFTVTIPEDDEHYFVYSLQVTADGLPLLTLPFSVEGM
jgi:hypothetical protein